MEDLREIVRKYKEVSDQRDDILDRLAELADPLERAAHKIAKSTHAYSRSTSYPELEEIVNDKAHFVIHDRDDPTFGLSYTIDELINFDPKAEARRQAEEAESARLKRIQELRDQADRLEANAQKTCISV